jgi:hypothetical protein
LPPFFQRPPCSNSHRLQKEQDSLNGERELFLGGHFFLLLVLYLLYRDAFDVAPLL